MDPTEKFQQSLLYALLPVSPALSALHSIRTRAQSSSCQKCGAALHRGESSVRTCRVKGSRSIQTTCLICGCVRMDPLPRGNAASYPRTRKGGPDAPPVITPEPPKQTQITANPMPDAVRSNPKAATSKQRSKKKNDLQSMLQRNKERESKEKQIGTGPGLAMFLNNL